MITKIKTTDYAKQLRKKLKELTDARPKILEQYKIDLNRWRADLKAWVRANLDKRIDALQVQGRGRRHFDYSYDFDAAGFFAGAPKPPKYPDDKQIRNIRNLLQQLGITGQKEVHVSTEDVARYLGEPGDAEE